MKNTSLLIAILIFSMGFVSAQLKVDHNGRIGFGTTTTHPDFIAYLKGNMVLTNYPQLGHNSFYFKVGNGWPGAELGNTGSSDGVAFWTGWTGFNILYAEKYIKMSDTKFKFDIVSIQSPIEKLMSLKAYKYNYRSVVYNEYNPNDSLVTMVP